MNVTQSHRQPSSILEPTIEWPDPTPDMLESVEFDAIWNCIKTWDINVPEVDGELYAGANGSHVRAILDALDKIKGL